MAVRFLVFTIHRLSTVDCPRGSCCFGQSPVYLLNDLFLNSPRSRPTTLLLRRRPTILVGLYSRLRRKCRLFDDLKPLSTSYTLVFLVADYDSTFIHSPFPLAFRFIRLIGFSLSLSPFAFRPETIHSDPWLIYRQFNHNGFTFFDGPGTAESPTHPVRGSEPSNACSGRSLFVLYLHARPEALG